MEGFMIFERSFLEGRYLLSVWHSFYRDEKDAKAALKKLRNKERKYRALCPDALVTHEYIFEERKI